MLWLFNWLLGIGLLGLGILEEEVFADFKYFLEERSVLKERSDRMVHGMEDWVYDDRIYEERIKTVQFYRGGFESSYPVFIINQDIPLTIEFDELLAVDERESDFMVDIVSCNADWEPSNVLPIEFYEGFVQDRINIFRRAQSTKVPYVHYEYTFPQDGEFFKMSGNYLLKIFRDNAKEDVVITRRFIVVDPEVSVELRYLLNQEPERLQLTELGFVVDVQNLQIRNPLRDMRVKVLQNFRWDNGVELDRPTFFNNEIYEYKLDLLDAFPGGNEFRFHDIRSLRLYSGSVANISERDEVFDVILTTDTPRLRNVYGPIRDLNGSFYIDLMDFPNADLQADYVYNLFSLKMPEVANGSVYLFGAFTDWHTYDQYKMSYDEGQERYEADILLKQGFYDYQYVIKKDGEVDDASLEGSHRDTENFYSILIYFRNPLDRNDRLIGFHPVNYVD